MEDIKEIANNCLNCSVKPCSMKGCPIHTNIPEFISEIKNDNLENAYNILQDNNFFSHICSIVCPQEKQCEGSCVRGIKGNPISIGKLERYVNENGKEKALEKCGVYIIRSGGAIGKEIKKIIEGENMNNEA